MSSPIIRVARVIRDLLAIPETQIKVGRIDWERESFDTELVTVDALSPAEPLTRGEIFDGEAEKTTFDRFSRLPIVIDFLGADAWGRAVKLQLLADSERSRQLQIEHGVTVGHVQRITNVAALVEAQHTEQVQVELSAFYSDSVTIGTLRIDTAQLEFLRSL